MYIFKNAFRCISRAKGRNILIGLVVMVLSISSCLGLSIKQANKTLKKQYANDMEITATLNQKKMNQNGIELETLEEYAKKESVKSSYKTASLYFSAGDSIEPLDVAGSFQKNKDFKDKYGDIKNGEERTESSTSTTGTSQTSNESGTVVLLAETESQEQTTSESANESKSEEGTESKTEGNSSKENEGNSTPNTDNGDSNGDFPTPPSDSNGTDNSGAPSMPGGGGDTFITNKFFFNMASMNDFTVVGYADEDALPEYVATLDVLSLTSDDNSCVISKNLAEENELEVGDTFTLKNPENEDETYEFKIVGIGDSSLSSNSSETSSNASFEDNYIHISYKSVEKIVAASTELNGTATTEDNEEKQIALSPTYSMTYVFANLSDYNEFKDSVSEDYSVVSDDVSNYEESVNQLESLGKYATYFLIVIFIIGAFVLVVINLFSIRNRKYEIGVLTAIGMKKFKVAMQFVIELFVVTFVALIIGSSIGAVTSVPVTNKLLSTINSTSTAEVADNNSTASTSSSEQKQNSNTPPEMPDGNSKGNGFSDKFDPSNFGGMAKNYVASINSATNITVIFQMIGIGILLTLVSALSAMLFIMRYEPLKILNSRD